MITKIEMDKTCASKMARWLYLLREHELDHLEHAERQGSWDLQAQYAGRARLLHQLVMVLEDNGFITGNDET